MGIGVDENEKRRAASLKAGKAARVGKIQKHCCWTCGAADVEAHHADYNYPLDVVWLCKRHHQEIHSEFSNTNSLMFLARSYVLSGGTIEMASEFFGTSPDSIKSSIRHAKRVAQRALNPKSKR